MQENWQKIYINYSPKLLGICRRYIQDIYTAEDIVHDSFITAIQKNDQLNDEKALFGWLKKIVINNALQHIRKESKDTFISTEPSEIPDTSSEMEHHLSEDKNIFIYDFTSEELLSSIDSLPTHHKSVFNLYFIENYSHTEISSILGITVNTSKSHLLRAKKSIQTYLLNNFVDQSKSKKKIAQLLVLFGFGGLLWAKAFQSKFADFKIQPSRKLEIPSDIKNDYSKVSTTDNLWKKLIIGGTFLVIIMATVFLLNPKLSIFPATNNLSVSPSSDIQDQNKIDTEEHGSEQHSYDSDTETSGLSIDETSSKNPQERFSSDKTDIEERGIKKRQELNKIIIKDSLDELPQKVIVVKKIIKRDTIFIEK